MKASPAILLAILVFLALAPAASGQPSISPTSLVYIQVEPQGLGEVGYYPSFGGPAREWPRATTPIGSFFTMAFQQGTYLYLEAKPYGCAELDRWEITPEEVEKTYYGGSREKLVLLLDQEYITVNAVFRKIPEDVCPYIPIWKSIRVKKEDLYTSLTVFAAVGSITAVAYRVKSSRERRRREESRKKFEVEMVREKLLERTIDWRRPVMITPWQVILWTSLKWPSLEEASLEDLKASLLDDERLRSLRLSQTSGMAAIAHCYISHASDMYTGNIPLLGLKTYLALFNLAPSTDEITKMYISSIDPRRIPILWHEMDGERAFKQILRLIRENINLQRRGLRKVIHLIDTDPEYARRIRNPPEYYEAILAFIKEWAAENLGVTFKGIRVRPEMRHIHREEERPTVKGEVKTGREVEKPREVGDKRDEIKLPEDAKMPEWLAKALDEIGKEERAEEEKIEKLEEEIRKKAEKTKEEFKEAPKPAIEKFEIPVKWDDLPRQLQRQIEDLGLKFEEVASIALRTMDKSEREVYREVNKLITEKYPGMDENSIVSTLLMVVNIISWLQNIMREREVKPIEQPRESKAPEPAKTLEETFKPAEKIEEEVGAALEKTAVEEGMKTEPVEAMKLEKAIEEEIPVEKTVEGKTIYDGVEVDHVGKLRLPIQVVDARRLYLIDSPAPWIPTSLMVEMFYTSSFCKPITLEGRKAHGRVNIVDELFNTLKKMCMIGDTIPVIVVGRPGYISKRVKEKFIYIERLREILKRLREAKARRFAVAMPFQVYKEYCMDIVDLQVMKKNVYVVDTGRVLQELRGKVPEGALPYLKTISSLSINLLYQLLKSPSQPSWEPWVYEKTGEEKALGWAVRTIYSKGGPLTVEEVVKAGYEEYLDSFKVLGMIEE